MLDNEATITINARTLNHAQSMTVRVALAAFAADIENNGLGDDELGKSIASGYLKTIAEIQIIMAVW